MQCCTCSKWVNLKCSLLFFPRFKTLGSSHFPSCPLCCVLASYRDFTPTNTDFLLGLLQFEYVHYATWPIWPPMLMQHFRPLRIFSVCVFITALCFWLFFYTCCFLFSLTPSRFFNGMLGVSNPRALNYYTLSRFILLTLFVSRNLTLTHLPLSGSLDSLLCDLIALTPGLAFFLLIPRTLAAASSFSFRPDLFFSELPTSSFSSLDPYSHYVGVNISLNNSFLSFLNVCALPIRSSRRMAEPNSFLSSFFPPPEIFLL